ncbi:DUF4430 domain-containing protein [Patescibacteria group bacterium]|nr:DUF4430 domain-containing protein [Patescibacteria group bacterium]
MNKKKIIAFLLLLFLVAPPMVVQGGVPEAVNYLKQQPADDWLTMALVAGGQSQVATDHLKTFSGTAATDYAKRILAIKAVGQNPASFAGVDLVTGLKGLFNNNQLGDKDLLNDDAWGLMALLKAGVSLSDTSVSGAKAYLLSNQNSDGGWSYAKAGESDTNDTAAVVMSLKYAGLSASDSALQSAINYLKQAQNNDGGWPYAPGGESDAGSTSWVVSALTAVGEAGLTISKNNKTAITFLQSLQLSNGAYKWRSQDSVGSPIMTAFVVVALSNKYYPVAALSSNQPNQAPQVAHLSGPLTVTCGQSNTFVAGAQDNEAGTLSLKIDWGDGSAVSQVTRQVSANQITSLDFSHSYTSNGQKNINLTVTDGAGLTDQAFFQVTVSGCGGGSDKIIFYRIEGAVNNYCSGQISATNPLQLMEQVATTCGLQLDIQTTALGRYLKGVNSDTAQGIKGWLYLVNLQQPAVAAADYQLQNGDDLIWFYGNFTDKPLRLVVDQTSISLGQSFTIKAEAQQNSAWQSQANINIKDGGQIVTTNNQGQAIITPSTPGVLEIYGEATGFIRSAKVNLTVNSGSVPSQAVSLEVDIKTLVPVTAPPPVAPTLSFVVSSSALPLGELSPGQSVQKQIIVTNTSSTVMHLEANVTGDQVFKDNLFLGNSLWDIWQAEVPVNSALGVVAKLVLPGNYQGGPGKKQGQLIFWAIASN